ncbi:MAG: hydroxyquinol 1,2-dioxygenase, partial [Solirubrobacteraceae bacterium]|nr:hydroxyquinol 1,2-dioxygenase [Solirubrobacteraceae bacterium]
KREQAVTDEVLASFAEAASPRHQEVMESLVRHLHAFAREVRLTEDEWTAGVEFLTRCGQITTDRRQEFILLSDVLGLSMLTIALNAPQDPRASEPTVFGPFFMEGSPEVPYGGDAAEGLSGERCWVQGRVTAVDGTAIAGATLEVWQADDHGFYDVQYGDGRIAGRAHTRTEPDGSYGFWSVRPAPYPIPDDGPVGDLLKLAGRSPMRPAHIHFMVTAPGYHRLVTHAFVAGDPHLGNDAVFGVKESLIVDFTEHPPGPGPAGRTLPERWWQLVFDLRLAPVTAPDA